MRRFSAYAIGAKFSTKSILKHFNISLKAFKVLKKKVINKISFSAKQRVKNFTSLSELDQIKIIELVSKSPHLLFNTSKIKSKLNLKCCKQTILNVLRHKGYRLHTMETTPYLSELNRKLKTQFCTIVKDLPYSSWLNVVFTDEKILQSYNNGIMKCFRLRINKKKGIGFDKRCKLRILYNILILVLNLIIYNIDTCIGVKNSYVVL